ncbi:MAG: hypothetical protein K0S70_2202, partial [Microbacterium sp.]|nr:hypothetical protein [Microbacterium sp.]
MVRWARHPGARSNRAGTGIRESHMALIVQKYGGSS